MRPPYPDERRQAERDDGMRFPLFPHVETRNRQEGPLGRKSGRTFHSHDDHRRRNRRRWRRRLRQISPLIPPRQTSSSNSHD